MSDVSYTADTPEHLELVRKRAERAFCVQWLDLEDAIMKLGVAESRVKIAQELFAMRQRDLVTATAKAYRDV